MTKKITKSAITALALIMLATSAGVASAANAAGAAGGGRGGNGGGGGSDSISISASGGGDGGSVNEWNDRGRKKTPPKPKLKLVRVFSENCQWEKKKIPHGSSYIYRYILECRKEVLQ